MVDKTRQAVGEEPPALPELTVEGAHVYASRRWGVTEGDAEYHVGIARHVAGLDVVDSYTEDELRDMLERVAYEQGWPERQRNGV